MGAHTTPCRLSLIVVAALAYAPLVSLAAPSPLPPADVIRSVWNLGSQPCNGGMANSYTRHPDEASVRKSKRLEVPELGYAFRVPQLPDMPETVVKLHLDDHARGVVDNYFLLSDQDLAVPVAAIVVTELPDEVVRDHKGFEAVRILQSQLAASAGVQPEMLEIMGPQGPGLEMLVPQRVGTDCFPTSEYQLVPASSGVHTLGISRFVVVDSQLIEYSIIVRLVAQESAAQARKRASELMDRFWLALEKL